MRIIFSIFVFGVLSSSAMAELVCERVSGCALFPEAKTESEYCPTCVEDSAPVLELTKSTNSDNICIEKFDECALSASKRKGGSTYLCYNIKSECEAGLK
tara:strand:- start:285 stop:584 length:300 start_codon:yes stop_codon:yes gene_type:complete